MAASQPEDTLSKTSSVASPTVQGLTFMLSSHVTQNLVTPHFYEACSTDQAPLTRYDMVTKHPDASEWDGDTSVQGGE